jgi:hypothetical protein
MFSRMALQVNSRSTYAAHHKNYLKFCDSIGHDALSAVTEELLCAAMIDYVRSHKVTTLPQYISAVANWHHEHSLGDLPRNRLFHRVQKGIHNVFGLSESVQSKTALSLADLQVFYSKMDFSRFHHSRDWLCYVLAFFGLLRIHEYIGSSLKFGHVKVKSWGISITIPFSKTNLQPVKVRLVRRDPSDMFDPVSAYYRYVQFIPKPLQHPNIPFFLQRADRSIPLSDAEYMETFKHRVHHYLHKPAANYAGHSFRRGGTTALFLAGVPETVIAAHGRWKSLAYRKYFDAAVNKLLPTAMLYQHAITGMAYVPSIHTTISSGSNPSPSEP